MPEKISEDHWREVSLGVNRAIEELVKIKKLRWWQLRRACAHANQTMAWLNHSLRWSTGISAPFNLPDMDFGWQREKEDDRDA